MKRKIFAALLAVSLTASLTACSSQGSSPSSGETAEEETEEASLQDTSSAADEDAREITVAAAPGYYPITYADENGEAAGYDVAVFEAIDELLDAYTFTFTVADKETMNVGVQTGTYQVGINSLFKTDERLETYLMPDTNMGYTAVGIIQREDSDYNTLQDLYDQGAKIYATGSSGGIRFVVQDWNEEHPDAQLDVELRADVVYADSLAAVQSGEYDAIINLIPVYNLQDEEAVAGLKISDPVDVIETFPIINMDEEDLAEQIEEALSTLTENGTLSELSIEYFGYDVFDI